MDSCAGVVVGGGLCAGVVVGGDCVQGWGWGMGSCAGVGVGGGLCAGMVGGCLGPLFSLLMCHAG